MPRIESPKAIAIREYLDHAFASRASFPCQKRVKASPRDQVLPGGELFPPFAREQFGRRRQMSPRGRARCRTENGRLRQSARCRGRWRSFATVSRRDVLRGGDYRSSSAPLSPSDKRSPSSGERRYPRTVVGTPAATPAIHRWAAGCADNSIRTKRTRKGRKRTGELSGAARPNWHGLGRPRDKAGCGSCTEQTRRHPSRRGTITWPSVCPSDRPCLLSFVYSARSSPYAHPRAPNWQAARRDVGALLSRARNVTPYTVVPPPPLSAGIRMLRVHVEEAGRRRWRGHRGSTTAAAIEVSIAVPTCYCLPHAADYVRLAHVTADAERLPHPNERKRERERLETCFLVEAKCQVPLMSDFGRPV